MMINYKKKYKLKNNICKMKPTNNLLRNKEKYGIVSKRKDRLKRMEYSMQDKKQLLYRKILMKKIRIKI